MTKKLENGFYVVCEGSYVGKVGGNPVSKQFEATLQVSKDPDFKPSRDDVLLHYVQRKLLTVFFKENVEAYPDFRRWRECSIIEEKRIGSTKKEEAEEGEIDIAKMKRKDLVLFCIDKGLITNPVDFATIQTARDAVSDEWENMQIAKDAVLAQEAEEIEKEDDMFSEFEDIK